MFARSFAVISKRASAAAMTRSHPLQQPTPLLTAATTTTTRFVHIEKRLEEKGIELPAPSAPKANYDICCHASGNMLYISGHLPTTVEDGSLLTGAIGPEQDGGKSVDHGYAAARLAGLAIVSTLKEQLGDLDRVEQVVKVCLSCICVAVLCPLLLAVLYWMIPANLRTISHLLHSFISSFSSTPKNAP